MSINLDAIKARIAETPPKLATIREMTPAEIGRVLTDRAALAAEVERLRKRDALTTAVADAARDYLGADAAMQSDPSALSVRIAAFDRWQSARATAYAALAALDALDALDAGGEGK